MHEPNVAVPESRPVGVGHVEPVGARRRVLIVDSEEDPVLLGVLDRMDCGVERKSSADQATLNAQGATAAIVTDVSDGALDACAALSRDCPVILVSDRPSFELRLAALDAGVSAVIQRPVHQAEVAEWLDRFAATHTPTPISVLVVDDDELATELYAAVLGASGMMVTTLNDPSSVLLALDELQPDLILMDVQMPGVDGIRLAQIIRQARRYNSLPIIFLSAERDETRQLAARQLGGDDFIAKSVSPERLVSIVRLRADRSREMRSLIERDGLTGLYDHSRFQERLSGELERCRRSGAECCFVLIDIDHFKLVNDTFGHPAGDEVLRTLSSALTSGLRRIDIVGRCGGEEFGVILLDTGPDAARAVIEKLKAQFSAVRFEEGDRTFSVAFSAGIASSRDFADVTDIVAAADRALYEAKRCGRNAIKLASLDASDPFPVEALPANRAVAGGILSSGWKRMTTQSLSGRTICVVDDDKLVRQYIALQLRASAITVLEAVDSAELFRLLETRKIDCILMDHALSSENGLFIQADLRNRFAHSPPVIMLSASEDQKVIIKAFRSGASDYLIKKGLRPEDLIQSLEFAIGRRAEEDAFRDELGRLKSSSMFDELTGFHRRETMDGILANLANAPARTRKSFAIVLLRIDQFDRVCKRCGQVDGQRLIREVAVRLKNTVRTRDICGRFDEKTFVYYVDVAANRADVEALVVRLDQATRFSLDLDAMSLNVSATFGLAIYPEDATDPDSLLQHAAAQLPPASASQEDDGEETSPSPGITRSEQRRQTPRHRTFKQGRIIVDAGASVMDCTVRDLSVSGARLRLAGILAVPPNFELRIAGSGMAKPCHRVWQRGGEIGVAFKDDRPLAQANEK